MDSSRVQHAAWQPRSAFTVAVAAASLAGAAAVFVPFTYGVSPALAAPSEFAQLGLPLCLGLPIAAGLLLWVITGHLSRRMRLAAYACAVVAAVAWGSLDAGFTFGRMFSPDIRHVPVEGLVPPMGVALALITALALARKSTPRDLRAVLLMQAIYVGDAVMCLVSFHEDLQAGAYLVAAAAAAFLAQGVVVTVAAWRMPVARPPHQPVVIPPPGQSA